MKKAKNIDLGIVTYRIDAFEQNVIWWWKNQKGSKIDLELLKRVKQAKKLIKQ